MDQIVGIFYQLTHQVCRQEVISDDAVDNALLLLAKPARERATFQSI